MAEIVGLRLEDIDLERAVVQIRPNHARRLKTPGSTRCLPLVGVAHTAIQKISSGVESEWLLPQYIKEDSCKATHASNALNKWLKAEFDGLTAHCLRHTIRDRLRAVECPGEIIDQIGGWSSHKSVGSSYGHGYSVEQVGVWLKLIGVEC